MESKEQLSERKVKKSKGKFKGKYKKDKGK